MFEFLENARRSVSDWLGSGPQTSDAATARGGSDARAERPASLWDRIGQSVGDLGRGFSQEGIGGLMDISGMLDRQQAQRDLSDRFQVVGDDFVGPRNHNQVSQAEYERIARTFSDIRTGRGDLTIDSSQFNNDADAARYRQGTMNNIADMMMTTAGREQIYGMSNNVLRDDEGNSRRGLFGVEMPFNLGTEIHRQTTISPLFSNPGDATQRDWAHLRTDNGYADPEHSDRMQRNADGTRGTGTDVNIRMNPMDILGLRSDVVLAHEMQHAMHETQGTMARGVYDTATGGQGPDATYQNTDDQGNVISTGINNWERQAVGLTRTDVPSGGHFPGDADGCTENTYREQRNQLGLGDRFVPRTDYTSLPGQAGPTDDLDQLWANHRAAQAADAARLGAR